MAKSAESFKPPPIICRDDGNPRRVGFELEFSGLTLEQASDVLQASLGGELQSESPAQRVLRVDPLGQFNVEVDWDFLKRKSAESAQKVEGDAWVEALGQTAALLVPIEVVCPPLAIDELAALERMVAALRKAGAVGTEESLLAAYGVHINAEIPNLEAATLSSYLTAFALLQWWLVEAHQVDLARKISPYVDLYPTAYLKQVLSRSEPSMDEIFADYLEHNATRNRALDLLPMMAEIDEDRVRRAVDDPKIKARPAFHYRLPNCHIEREDWSLSQPWNVWWVVEELAQRPDDLRDLGAKFLEAERPVLDVSRADWVAFLDQWLKAHQLA